LEKAQCERRGARHTAAPRQAARRAAALGPSRDPRLRQALFDEYDVPIELDLLEQRSFEQGVTMHRYAVHDVSEASSC
jgi:hypothetical protein